VDPTGIDPENNEWYRNIFQWVKNLFTIEIDPQNIEKSKQLQDKKNETITQATEVINLYSNVISLLNPLASTVEVIVNADMENTEAALAAVPFAILDVATMGEGKIVSGGVKFLKAEQLAKKLGTTVADYHKTIKNVMKKDFAKEMKAIGTTNPDFSPI
jgi:microcystin degradation protein MlrC